MTDDEKARFELDRTKASQDYELRKRELDIKERELRRQDRLDWRNPLVVSIIIAAIGLFSNAWVAGVQNRANQVLAREKEQSDLIVESVKASNCAAGEKNLLFFVAAHLIDDQVGAEIQKAIRDGAAPCLPSAVAQEQIGEAQWQNITGYAAAAASFADAARLGNARAMANLGWALQFGFGVQADCSKAKAQYEKAVQNGDHIANWNMGFLYEKGCKSPDSEIAPDATVARQWYERGAKLSEPNAVRSLAQLNALTVH